MKWIVVSTLIIILISWISYKKYYNNVCKTFDDYYTDRDSNKNCYYNPDYQLEVPDIIQRHGYPLEQYEIATDDGYILALFRIPYGKNSTYKKHGKPVILQHGMVLNSGIFVNTGRKSLGFILADAGYDVWLGNFRGSLYSRNHINLSSDDIDFWDFSFHEYGVYDIPAQLNFIQDITKQKIIFVGYSLGSTAAYVYGSVNPKDAYEKVEIFINLAPAVYLDNVSFTFRLLGHLWPILEIPLNLLTKGKLFPRQIFQSEFVKLLCLTFPFQMRLCLIPEMSALGFSFEQIDPETLPITLQHNADVTSIKTVTHFSQVGHSSEFRYFDYGTESNKIIYGASEPKHYNLSNIKVPSYSVVAENDFGARIEDINRLYKILPKKTTSHGMYVVKDETFNHLDFITGKDVVPLVYNHVVTFLNSL